VTEDVTDSLLAAFEHRGHTVFPPCDVRAPSWDTTLFVSGGIQNWHAWSLDPASAGQARVGAQWCVRTNRLYRPGSLTSFCMVSGVRVGWRSREDTLAEVISALDACGIGSSRLAFVATQADGDRPADDGSVAALARLGVPADRIATWSRKWAQPYRPTGPTGPNLFVLAESGPPCGPDCGPLCGCGRFQHFWNVELLDHVREADGSLRPAEMPITDIAGSVEFFTRVRDHAPDTLSVEPLRTAAERVRAVAGVEDPLLVDHGRTGALLLGSGVRAEARAHGHVLRRLLRRMCTLLVTMGADLDLMPAVVLAASTGSAGRHGFPPREAIEAALGELDGELAAFRAVLASGRRRYQAANGRAVDPTDLAELLFRIKADLGVPLPILTGWCAADGRQPCEERIAALAAGERAASRPASANTRS
jgi:alanyl-tRNA synthetase